MLKIEKTVTMSPEQWEIVIEGMRNAKNSWDRIDSYTTHICDPETLETADFEFFLGENDEKLMKKLAAGGSVHAKYRRMMPIWVTIDAPLYWWKEFDTYKVGTVSNSCSTMHKIHAKKFTLDDFSCEHLIDYSAISDETRNKFINLKLDSEDNHIMVSDEDSGFIGQCIRFSDSEAKCCIYTAKDILELFIIPALNANREAFLKTKDKKYWWQMIQLLPSSYNQKRTIKLNYEVLVGIYKHRRNHKLNEWSVFCDWIEQLPHSDLIIGEPHDAQK